MTPQLLASCVDRTIGFEGSIAWLYRDFSEKGWPTTGAGHALFSQYESRALPWKIGDRDAFANEIYKDFQVVLAAPLGHTAAYYEPLTVCRLTDEDIRGLCGNDIQVRMTALRKWVPQWDQYPPAAIQAIADMTFSLGPAWPVDGEWPKLAAAVLANDWREAAVQCHRAAPISEARNKTIAALFLQAANPSLHSV